MKKNLQSLSLSPSKIRLSKKRFQLLFLLLITSLTGACANNSSGHAALEACSYADTVKAPEQFKEAFDECLDNAKSGDPVAQKNLAFMYYMGNIFVAPDVNESTKWFKAAASQGNQLALHRLNQIEGNRLTALAQ